MRPFSWLLIVAGILVAIAVPLKAEREIGAFVDSTDYKVWSLLEDKRTWRPSGLRSAMYWDGWRWPAVYGGAGVAALGILVPAIRRPVSAGE